MKINKIGEQQNNLLEKMYHLECQKADIKVAMGQFMVILKSGEGCPDEDSKDIWRMLKQKSPRSTRRVI